MELNQREQEYLDGSSKSYKAVLMHKNGYLSDDFIAKLACKRLNLLPEELEKLVGRYSKGKRKGLLKGMLTWNKCLRGGWVKTGSYDDDMMRGTGYVAKPGHTYNYRIVDAFSSGGGPAILSDKDVVQVSLLSEDTVKKDTERLQNIKADLITFSNYEPATLNNMDSETKQAFVNTIASTLAAIKIEIQIIENRLENNKENLERKKIIDSL